MSKNVSCEVHQSGFQWGGADIRRFCDDTKAGWVIVGIITKKYPHGLQVYVTKTGKVRISDGKSEWKPEVK